MFPNVRLMVVAILAAIAGIGCGLGLFATFRVNHEPLARLAEGSPPMQLAFDNLALGSDGRAGMESRLPVTGVAKTISVPMIVPTPEPAVAEQAGADSALTAESTGVQQADAGVEAADQGSSAIPAVPLQADPPSVNAEAAEAAPSRQDVIATAQDQAPAASAAAASSAEQTAAISAAAPDQEPALKPIKPAESKPAATRAVKPKARASHAVAPARRATKTVRPRRTVTTVAAQSAYPYSQPTYSQPVYSQQAYSQPAYTWMDGAAQASRPVRRVQIKRSRIVKQAAPAAQSTPSASTAGLSGPQ
jgi:hypothetical protein